LVWRAGLDLSPLDVRDDGDVRWLQALVWPGEGERARLLEEALAVARRDPPRVVKGDLRHDLAALAVEAPKDATLVVFHTAVRAYVPEATDRNAFAFSLSTIFHRLIRTPTAQLSSGSLGPVDGHGRVGSIGQEKWVPVFRWPCDQ
jgi:hypothetical protein